MWNKMLGLEGFFIGKYIPLYLLEHKIFFFGERSNT